MTPSTRKLCRLACASALLLALSAAAEEDDAGAGAAPAGEVEPAEDAEEPRPEEEEPSASGSAKRPLPPGVDEILVTAQRREEAMQEAAVSVTAFDMEDLMAQGSSDLTGVAKFTPNLEIKNAFAASNPTLFIRGVGLKDYFANASSAVAVWNDGIYMNSPTGQLFQLFDLQDVQVLKGPQGSQFGRNATAGAILVEARKPTGEYAADFTAEYGNYDHTTVSGAVELPVLDDLLSTRGAFRINKRDGITENRCAESRYADAQTPPAPGPGTYFCNNFATRPIKGVDDRVNDVDNWAARGLFRLTPIDDMEWLLNVHGGQNRSTALQFQKLGSQPEENFPRTRDRNNYFDADLPQRVISGRPTPLGDSPLDGDPYKGDYNRTGDEDVDLFGTILTGTWQLGDFKLTSITGWSQNARDTEGNEDANPFVLLEIDWSNDAWQLTQDLRLAWDSGADFTFELGLWGLLEDLNVDNRYRFTAATVLNQDLDQEDRAFAVFGYGTYHLSEDVWLEGGVRFNWDQKDFRISSDLAGNPVGSGDETEVWRGLGGDFSANWSPVDDVIFYLKYAHAFKAGQFNGAAVLSADLAAIEPVDPETTDSFEVGIKSHWWDRRLMVNAAAFYTRYNDQQVFQLSVGAGSLPTPELINANDSVTYGLEFETRISPWEWLEIFTAFGLLESEYLDFTNQLELADPSNPSQTINVTADYSGNRLLNSPTYAWSGFLEATWPIGSLGWIVPRFDWTYKSEVYFDQNEGRGLLGEFPKGTLGQKDLWLFNARLAYRTPGERMEIAGWVRNLTDEEYVVDAFDVSQQFATLNYVIGTPRFYGGSVSFRF